MHALATKVPEDSHPVDREPDPLARLLGVDSHFMEILMQRPICKTYLDTYWPCCCSWT